SAEVFARIAGVGGDVHASRAAGRRGGRRAVVVVGSGDDEQGDFVPAGERGDDGVGAAGGPVALGRGEAGTDEKQARRHRTAAGAVEVGVPGHAVAAAVQVDGAVFGREVEGELPEDAQVEGRHGAGGDALGDAEVVVLFAQVAAAPDLGGVGLGARARGGAVV